MSKGTRSVSEAGAALAEYAVLVAALLMIAIVSAGIMGQRISDRLAGGGSCSSMQDCDTIIEVLRYRAVAP